MKTLRSRVMLLGAALGLVLVLGTFLLRPAKGKAHGGGFPWKAAAGVVVIGGLALVARRKTTASRQAGIERLNCLEQLRLQPGKVLHLVEADGKRLLVSTCERGVQLLCDLDPAGCGQEEDSP